jgi:hypothetical protein
MARSVLIGYVRKSRGGSALKVNISAQAFEKAQRYMSKSGEEFVGLVVNLDRLKEVISGEREVTSICQIGD